MELLRKCPKCKNGNLDQRTSRGFLVKLLFFWLPIKRYRCSYCRKKTYLYESTTIGSAQPEV